MIVDIYNFFAKICGFSLPCRQKLLTLYSEIKGAMLEWLKRHAWKACIRQKRIPGSNPGCSANNTLESILLGFQRIVLSSGLIHPVGQKKGRICTNQPYPDTLRPSSACRSRARRVRLACRRHAAVSDDIWSQHDFILTAEVWTAGNPLPCGSSLLRNQYGRTFPSPCLSCPRNGTPTGRWS